MALDPPQPFKRPNLPGGGLVKLIFSNDVKKHDGLNATNSLQSEHLMIHGRRSIVTLAVIMCGVLLVEPFFAQAPFESTSLEGGSREQENNVIQRFTPSEAATSEPTRFAESRTTVSRTDVSSPPPEASPLPTGASPRANIAAANGMIVSNHTLADGTPMITVVNTRRMWLAVYHIERSGKPVLVGSRPMESDFELLLNAASPLPAEINPARWQASE